MDGIYVMYYTGKAGSGHAVFIMKDGVIAGADAIGGVLDGNYKHVGDSKLDVSVTLTMPIGGSLVTGVTAEGAPLVQRISVTLPENLGNRMPVGIQTPTGPVNVVFKRLRAIP